MSCSSNEAAARLASLNPRLAAAVAASVALHALLVVSLGSPFGARWGALSLVPASVPHGQPIRAVLRAAADKPAAPALGLTAPGPIPPAPPLERAARGGATASAAPAPAQAETPQRALLPESQYYRTRELDVPPGVMTRVEPEYPEAAARRFLSGRVVIRLFISEAGAVERVEVVRAEPPGHFEAATERAFLATRFSPGMKGGRPVKVLMTLEVAFDSPGAPELSRP